MHITIVCIGVEVWMCKDLHESTEDERASGEASTWHANLGTYAMPLHDPGVADIKFSFSY